MEDGSFDTTPLPQVMRKVLDESEIKIDFMDWHTFTNKSLETGIEHPISRSYAIHHFAGSWHGRRQKLFKIVARIIGNKATQHISAFLKQIHIIK